MYLTQFMYVTDNFSDDWKCSIKIKLVQISLNKKNQNYYVKRMYEGSPTYKVNRKQFKYYKTVDISKDGTKELFLSTISTNFVPYGHRVMLMTY